MPNVISIEEFRAGRAALAAERRRNLSKVPKIVSAGKSADPSTSKFAKSSDGDGVVTISSGPNYPVLCELLELALFDLASAADGIKVLFGSLGASATSHQEVQYRQHLEVALAKAWQVYNEVRAAQR